MENGRWGRKLTEETGGAEEETGHLPQLPAPVYSAVSWPLSRKPASLQTTQILTKMVTPAGSNWNTGFPCLHVLTESGSDT
jgi:hypothetical protein